MSSLYDKYYSQHNRTYMYNLIKNLILKDHTIDISINDTYNQFFETNFMNTFKKLIVRIVYRNINCVVFL